jgi:hypothetical protein
MPIKEASSGEGQRKEIYSMQPCQKKHIKGFSDIKSIFKELTGTLRFCIKGEKGWGLRYA